jgi:hypothetical protein
LVPCSTHGRPTTAKSLTSVRLFSFCNGLCRHEDAAKHSITGFIPAILHLARHAKSGRVLEAV